MRVLYIPSPKAIAHLRLYGPMVTTSDSDRIYACQCILKTVVRFRVRPSFLLSARLTLALLFAASPQGPPAPQNALFDLLGPQRCTCRSATVGVSSVRTQCAREVRWLRC